MIVTNFQRRGSIEKRTDPRKPYSGHIFFSTKNRLYEGSLKNFSRDGLFIATSISRKVGEIITVALPYLEVNAAKRKGQIIWSNKEGFGVELFRRRNGKALKHLQSEIKLLNRMLICSCENESSHSK
jgi:Tfp pilus assembly protein PilZ